MANTPETVSRYDIGDLVQLRATFLGTDGVTPADPSTMVFSTINPFGTIASYSFGAAGASVIRTGAGAYFKEVTVDVPGQWYYRAQGTGGAQAAEEWPFIVNESFIL